MQNGISPSKDEIRLLKKRIREDAEDHFWIVERAAVLTLVSFLIFRIPDMLPGRERSAVFLIQFFCFILVAYATWHWSAVFASYISEETVFEKTDNKIHITPQFYGTQFFFWAIACLALLIGGQFQLKEKRHEEDVLKQIERIDKNVESLQSGIFDLNEKLHKPMDKLPALKAN